MENLLRFSRFVEDKVKRHYLGADKKFSSGIIKEKLDYAITQRAMEWDDQADIGWRIRNNELPLVLDRKNWERFKDKYFKDNWIVKSIRLKNSYLVGGNVFFDVKRFDGDEINDPVVSPIENEINFAYIYEDGVMQLIEVLNDLAFTGVGIDRTVFNPFRRTQFWMSGRIEYRHVDSRNVWFLSTDGLCQNIYAIFYRTPIDTETLKLQYPSVAEKITESASEQTGDAIEIKGKTYVWTCQFMHTLSFTKREVKDMLGGQSWLYLDEEIDSFKENLKKQYVGEAEIDETFTIIQKQFAETIQDNSSEAFNQYVDEEEFTLEEMAISPHSVRDDDDLWFQILMTDNNVILPQETGVTQKKAKETTEMKYIGTESGFHFIPGIKRNKSAYPFGSAWFSADMLEIKTLLMTSLAMLVMKNNKPMPSYEKGSLQNEEEWLGGWWRMDIAAIVDPKWRKQNPAIKPFEFQSAHFDKQSYLTLDNIATESIKNQEGAIDSLRGVQSSANQSGVQTAQLQAAGTTYQKIDEMYVHKYLKDVGQTFLNLIAKYRRYPHKMVDYNEDGTTKQVDVNTSPDNMYDIDKYYVQPIIEPTPEIAKQQEELKAKELFAQGLMHPLDYIKATGVKNPEKIYQRSQVYAQIKQIMELMETNPELAQAAGGAPQEESTAGPTKNIEKAKNKVAGMQQ